MAKTITLELRPEDAEPILRSAAYNAAKFGAWLDYITRRTRRPPCAPTVEARKHWQERFLAAKRMVEAFGVEYESTSEEETMTVDYDYVGGKRVRLGETEFHQIIGSKPDFDHPQPCYRGEVHSQACHSAADRVVQAWRQMLTQEKIAA